MQQMHVSLLKTGYEVCFRCVHFVGWHLLLRHVTNETALRLGENTHVGGEMQYVFVFPAIVVHKKMKCLKPGFRKWLKTPVTF